MAYLNSDKLKELYEKYLAAKTQFEQYTALVLPDDPSSNNFTAADIKKKSYQPDIALYDMLLEVSNAGGEIEGAISDIATDIENLKQKDTLLDSDIANLETKLANTNVLLAQYKEDIDNKILNIPTKTSDIKNDSGFITNEVNDLVYYFTKDEATGMFVLQGIKINGHELSVNDINISKADIELGLVQNRTIDNVPIEGSTNYISSGAVYSAINALAGVGILQIKLVSNSKDTDDLESLLPTASIASLNTLYFVENTTKKQKEGNKYSTYITYQKADKTYAWESIEQPIDLSSYATLTQLEQLNKELQQHLSDFDLLKSDIATDKAALTKLIAEEITRAKAKETELEDKISNIKITRSKIVVPLVESYFEVLKEGTTKIADRVYFEGEEDFIEWFDEDLGTYGG